MQSMRVVSVRTGKPKQIEFAGRSAISAIFKSSVQGAVTATQSGLEGDCQVEPAHGGPFKALYAYSISGYRFWENQLGREAIEPGSFGENLTIDGLIDAEVCSGDRFMVGEVEIMATTPRIPCFKLEIRMETPKLIDRFLAADWPGIYFKVIRGGPISEGDTVEVVYRESGSLTVVELMRMYSGADRDPDRLHRAIGLSSIPPEWRERLARFLQPSNTISS